jgi:hypothetical protein
MSLRPRSEALHAFNAAPGAASPITVVAALPGAIIKVYRFIITVGAVTTPPALAQFTGSVSGPLSQQFQLAAEGQLNCDDGNANLDPMLWTAAGEALQLTFSGGNLSYDVWYLQGP